MATRRNERVGRPRPDRSPRARPSAPRPTSTRRSRNPAPAGPSTGPITDAISLDLLGEDGAPFDDAVTAVLDRLDDGSGVEGGEQSVPSAGDGAKAAQALKPESAQRAAAPRRSVRAPARALAARWQRLNPRRAIVLAVVLGFVALTLAMPLRTYFSQRAELDGVRAANTAIERENTELTRKVNEQGDPAYVEAQARARLQYVRPGETPFVLEIPGREAAVAQQRRAAERASNPWFANLWDSVATPPQK